MVQEFKELRSDENDPLFDKTNMLKKEFPSDFRQIRYFTLLIVQSAPTEIKELNLLEQQISEVIKNAVKHGNHCDINKKVTVWYSFSATHAHIIVQDEGEGGIVIFHAHDVAHFAVYINRRGRHVHGVVADWHFVKQNALAVLAEGWRPKGGKEAVAVLLFKIGAQVVMIILVVNLAAVHEDEVFPGGCVKHAQVAHVQHQETVGQGQYFL